MEGAHLRVLPRPELAPFVAHFWKVSWEVKQPVTVQTLPHPCVQLVLEAGRLEVSGVFDRRFTRALEGKGEVFGIKFRPAMFSAFFEDSLATLTNRVVSAASIFGRSVNALRSTTSFEERCEAAEAFLLGRVPRVVDERAIVLRDVVEALAVDREASRLEWLTERTGLSPRALQRGFRRYVGVGPRWVIQRYRLHEAAEQLGKGKRVNLAVLADELGYSDQAHFTRDFKRVVGVSPGQYAK